MTHSPGRLSIAGAMLLLALPWSVGPASAQEATCDQPDWETITCRWSFSAEEGDVIAQVFELPVFERTHAAFVVTLLGKDNGWTLTVEAEDADGDGWHDVSSSEHAAQNDLSYRHMENSAHILIVDGSAAHRVRLTPSFDPTPQAPDAPASLGRWTVAYQGQRIPTGETPIRPAATLEHPHLADLIGDADDPAYDIAAAWFDDAQIGDGLMDAHMRLAGLTDPINIHDALGLPAESVGWKLAWGLDGERYYVEWLAENAEVSGQTRTFITCTLRREAAEGDTSGADVVLAVPFCGYDFHTGTLVAHFAEASIGGPPDGVIFDHPEARTRIYAKGRNVPDVVDDATTPSFLFALGGPRVWAELDGGELGQGYAAWYKDPFSQSNFIDTMQVLASALAATTFLVGLFFVARRRRKTHALLHRVDDAIHGNVDSRETLMRLGRIESEFSEMYRRGKITEGQYQVLSQRIATVATRHALRHSLGLNDGVPGDDAPGRTIPIRETREPTRRH